jgi:SAM-dependent methyltransferase
VGGFSDHFSNVAPQYAEFRPRYPVELYDFIVGHSPGRRRAWDCGTGSGQAALALAEYFSEVIATDASEEQIRYAALHPRVSYRVAPAEHSGLKEDSVDLVTVAQALHWFDIPAFFAEARRVLRGHGLIAVWAYDHLETSDGPLDDRLRILHATVLGPYWPPERRLVEEGYRYVDFPFAELTAPRFRIERELSLDELIGYLRTWSAARRYLVATQTDVVESAAEELRSLWGVEGKTRRVRWPIYLRLGRAL